MDTLKRISGHNSSSRMIDLSLPELERLKISCNPGALVSVSQGAEGLPGLPGPSGPDGPPVSALIITIIQPVSLLWIKINTAYILAVCPLLSHSQGLPGTLHDLEGDLLVRFLPCIPEKTASRVIWKCKWGLYNPQCFVSCPCSALQSALLVFLVPLECRDSR